MTTIPGNKDIAVVITFLQGSFQSGFDVSLRILNAGVAEYDTEISGLPPAPDLPALYQVWRERYGALGDRTITPVPNQPTHSRSAVQDCSAAARALEQAMTRWFQHDKFRFLQNEIRGRRVVSEDDSVPIIFNFKVPEADQLRRLPWHIWNLFSTDLLNAEVVLQTKISPRGLPAQGPLKVLAIYGSKPGNSSPSDNINTEEDRAAWAALQERPDVTVTELDQPTRSKLRNTLLQQPWDILFFAGHSSSEESQHGTLQIGLQPDGTPRYLRFAQLRDTLRQAVRNGLKLAIFNSCDGLGMADLLTELEVPFIIVMREPVADLVARRFIQVFLKKFSQGKRFYPAVRAARRELDWLENDFHNPLPSATWLPVVLQNPSQPELQWPAKPKRKLQLPWIAGVVLGVIALGSILISVIEGRQNPPKVSDNSTLTTPPQSELSLPYSSVLEDNASLGEDLLTPTNALKRIVSGGEPENCNLASKRMAKGHMLNGEYGEAEAQFNQFLGNCSVDAEAQIYQNNAAVLKTVLVNGTSFSDLTDADRRKLSQDTIMLSVPVPLGGREPGIAQEIMRGAAKAQRLFNESTSQRKMLLQIVNDDTSKDRDISDAAEEVAKMLVKDPAIFAIVGHYNSDATEDAGKIYHQNEIVAVSPTSTAIRSSDANGEDSPSDAFILGDFIFRVSPDDDFNANIIVNDILKQDGIRRILIAFTSDDDYSISFKDAVVRRAGEAGIEVGEPCDLLTRDISNCYETNQGAQSIVFIPSSEAKNEGGDFLEENSLKLPIWAGDAAYSGNNFTEWGENFVGAKTVVPWHPDSEQNDGSVFVQGSGVSWRTAMAYDATMALAEAIERQQRNSAEPQRAELREILADPEFAAEGILGEGSIRFKSNGDRIPPNELDLPAPNRLGILGRVVVQDDEYKVEPLPLLDDLSNG